MPAEGGRIEVASRYRLHGAGRSFGFAVRGREPQRALVIDPEILSSKTLSGSAVDEANGVAVDAQGNAYVAGTTFSSDFPATLGAYDVQHNGARDVFVTKLAPNGTDIVYSTYVGGAAEDEGKGIAVDSQGAAYVVGLDSSADFPRRPGRRTRPTTVPEMRSRCGSIRAARTSRTPRSSAGRRPMTVGGDRARFIGTGARHRPNRLRRVPGDSRCLRPDLHLASLGDRLPCAR